MSVSKECNETGNERAEFDGPQIVLRPVAQLLSSWFNTTATKSSYSPFHATG